jgi:hypothetical protein
MIISLLQEVSRSKNETNPAKIFSFCGRLSECTE